MFPILNSLSQDEINRRAALNAENMNTQHLKLLNNITIFQDERYSVYISNISTPKTNVIQGSQMSAEEITKKVPQIINTFQKQKKPFTWLVQSTSEPINLSDILKTRYGFQKKEEVNMISDLTKSECPQMFHRKIQLIPAKTPDHFSEFYELVQEIFEYPPKFTEQLRKKGNEEGNFHKNAIHLLGYLQNEAIAIGLIFRNQGIAGIYWLGVKKDFRDEGIGSCFLYKILKKIRKMGFRYASLQSPKTQIEYFHKIGFTEISNCYRMIWKPPQSRSNF